MSVLGKLVAVVTADTTKFTKSMLEVEGRLKGVNRVAKSTGVAFAAAAATGIGALTVAFQQLSEEVVKTGATFEQSITTLGALKGAADLSGKAFQDSLIPLENQARLLGEKTLFTATQAANAMQSLARAGMSVNEILGTSGSALLFAGANATTMSGATGLLAATMAQFNMTSSESAHITDVFTVALQNSLLDMESLTTSMRYAGSVAASLGMSLEETTAAIALFRDLGLDGSTAGTQFRQAMLALAGPTEKARGVLEKYSLEMKDAQGNMKSFEQVMLEIGQAQLSMEEIVALVSKRAAGSVATISKNFAEENSKYQELLEKFGQQANVTEKTYNKMINTVAGQFGILTSKVEESFLSIFDAIKGSLLDLVKEGQTFVQELIFTFQALEFYLRDVFEQEISNIARAFGIESESTSRQLAALIIVVGRFSSELIQIIPTLGKILLAMGSFLTMFVAYKGAFVLATGAIYGFTAALAALKTGLMGLISLATFGAGATTTLGLSFTALAPPILGVIAAVAALTTVVSIAIGTENIFNSTLEDTEELTKRNTAAIKEFKEEHESLARVFASTTKEKLAGIEAELTAQDLLEGRLQTQINALSNLNEETIAQQAQQGRLARVFVDGEQIFLSHSLAVGLVATGLEKYQSIGRQVEEQQIKLNNQADASKEKYIALESITEKLRATVEGTGQGFNNIAEFSSKLRLAGLTNVFSEAGLEIGLNEANLKKLNVELKVADTQYKQVSQKAKGYSDALKEAIEAQSRFTKVLAAREALEEMEKQANESAAAFAKWKKEVESLTTVIDKLIAKLQDANNALMTPDALKLSVQVQQEIRDANKSFDRLIELYAKNSAKQIEIRKKQARAIALINANAQISELEQQREQTKKDVTELRRRGMSEVELLKEKYAEIGKLQEAQSTKTAALIEAGLKTELEALEDITKARELQAERSTSNEKELEAKLVDIRDDAYQKSLELKNHYLNLESDFNEQHLLREQAQYDRHHQEMLDLNEEALRDIQEMTLDIEDETGLLRLQRQQEIDRKAFQAKYKGLEDYHRRIKEFDEAQRKQTEEAEKSALEKLGISRNETQKKINELEIEIAKNRNKARDKRLKQQRSYYQKLLELETRHQSLIKALESEDALKGDNRISTQQELLKIAQQISDLKMSEFSALDGTFSNFGQLLSGVERDIQRLTGSLSIVSIFKPVDSKEVQKLGIEQGLLESYEGIVFQGSDYSKQMVKAQEAFFGFDSAFRMALRSSGKLFERNLELGSQTENQLSETMDKVSDSIFVVDTLYARTVRGFVNIATEFRGLVSDLIITPLEATRDEAGNLGAESSFSFKENFIKTFQDKDGKLSAWQKPIAAGYGVLDKLSKKNAKLMIKVFVKAAKVIKKAFITIVKVSKKALTGLKNTAQKLTKFFTFMTGGFSLKIVDALKNSVNEYISKVDEVLGKQEQLRKQFEAGEITESEFREGMSMLDPTAQGSTAATEGFKQNIEKAMQTAQAVASIAPTIIQEFVRSVPLLIDTVIASGGQVLQALSNAAPDIAKVLVGGFVNAIGSLVDLLVSSDTGAAVSRFFSDVFLPAIDGLGAAFSKLLSNPDVINNMLKGLVAGGVIFAQALSQIMQKIMEFFENNPDMVGNIIRAVISTTIKLTLDALQVGLRALVLVIVEFVKQLPSMIGDLFANVGDFFNQLILGWLRTIIVQITGNFFKTFITGIGTLIVGFFNLLADIVLTIFTAITDVVRLILGIPEIIRGILQGIGGMLGTIYNGFLNGFTAVFGRFEESLDKLLDKISSLRLFGGDGIIGGSRGAAENEGFWSKVGNFFNDTPGPIKVGAKGMTAGFAPHDTVIAAQSASDLLGQAMQAYAGEMGGMFGAPAMAGGSSAPIDIAIMAEGRLLDAVQVTAMNRGNAPEMTKRFKRASGVDVGFNRGRYNKF